jgi:hypothetical protein
MKTETKNNIFYGLKILIPIIIVIGLFLGGVSAGIITFEAPKTEVNTGLISVTIELDFSDGTTYSDELTLENITGFDLLLELVDQNIITIETTYWESFGGYNVDSISYLGKTYAGDTSHYWSFYVNGELSMEGADKLYANDNDIITWKYESF